jgi:hypothetical protein
VARILQHNRQVEDKQRYLNFNETGGGHHVSHVWQEFCNTTGKLKTSRDILILTRQRRRPSCVPCVARILQHNGQVEGKQRYLSFNETEEEAIMCPMCGKNFATQQAS